MGKRTLKKWLLNPLKNKKKIEERLDAVQELINDRELSQSLDKILSKIYDIERLTTKITSGLANPKDLHALKTSIKPLPHLKELLLKASSNLLKELGNSLDTLSDIGEKLERTIEDNPPATFKEGGVIKRGVCEELDQLKDIKENAEKYLKELEERERKRTGIQSLKVGYNSVFCYYIEVSKPNLKFVPEDYIRKQTLVNAERFITKELKEFEEKLLTAQERIEALELEIFRKIRNEISENSQRLFQTSEKIGIIDALNSLSKVAKERDYVRPAITEDFSIFIKEGKHPVLEKILQEDFIPNDTYIDENHFIILLTGPNMGGKSVFLRQTALIVLMAHIGSFVPAKEAKISIVDKIFSRVGSADDISRGLSTFMMEMVETSNILRNATSKSLIILDEIGRGTSTKDGLSIARAVIEYIATKIKAKTLFATHYHELTELEGTLKGLKNYHVSVEEVDGKVVFTHKVLPGASEKSYGIHVAELAGLPEEVIERAKEILSEIEKTKVVSGLPLFEKEEEEEDISEVVKILESVEISETTPLEALMLLARLKKALKKVRS
jgi:DNA mismatch repair protein MutS